jgi:hypothetical protein
MKWIPRAHVPESWEDGRTVVLGWNDNKPRGPVATNWSTAFEAFIDEEASTYRRFDWAMDLPPVPPARKATEKEQAMYSLGWLNTAGGRRIEFGSTDGKPAWYGSDHKGYAVIVATTEEELIQYAKNHGMVMPDFSSVEQV